MTKEHWVRMTQEEYDRYKSWVFNGKCINEIPNLGFRCSNCCYQDDRRDYMFCPSCGAEVTIDVNEV